MEFFFVVGMNAHIKAVTRRSNIWSNLGDNFTVV
jgi:hypothetical protein